MSSSSTSINTSAKIQSAKIFGNGIAARFAALVRDRNGKILLLDRVIYGFFQQQQVHTMAQLMNQNLQLKYKSTDERSRELNNALALSAKGQAKQCLDHQTTIAIYLDMEFLQSHNIASSYRG